VSVSESWRKRLVDGDVKIDLCLEHGKGKVSLSSFWLRKLAIVMLLDGFSHVMLGVSVSWVSYRLDADGDDE